MTFFAYYSSLKKVRIKKFPCQGCDKGFTDGWKLKRHEKIHIKTEEISEPKYVPMDEKVVLVNKTKNSTCEICSKNFGDSWKLKRHEKIHGSARKLLDSSNFIIEETEIEENIVEYQLIIVFDSDFVMNPYKRVYSM